MFMRSQGPTLAFRQMKALLLSAAAFLLATPGLTGPQVQVPEGWDREIFLPGSRVWYGGLYRCDVGGLGGLTLALRDEGSRFSTYGNLEKRRYEGSRRKSWYRDRRVKRAWNSRGPHDASRCLLRHLHPFDTIPPRHRRAPSLSQRPGILSSNDNPTIATTPSDHYTCTNPYLC